MTIRNDTIAAIATAQAPAGIGIIRISGEQAVTVGDALFRNARGKRQLSELSAGVLRYGCVVDTSEERIDEVMAVRFIAPHSYTGEDMVELQCHGGLLVLHRVLDAVLAAGARLAEPGEFTKRAFLNGRIDLTQAEAVMDVIAADNEHALKNAERQISGALFERVNGLRDRLLRESAFIEAALDDPESFAGELDGYGTRLAETAEAVTAGVEELLSHADEGMLFRQGVRTAIIGRPNAGKSSLLNLLAGTERSIVTEIPGTTRDTVEESVRIGEITLHLIDTAGIIDDVSTEADADRQNRVTTDGRLLDPVERIGIERAKKALDEAELVLFVQDITQPVHAEDVEIFSRIGGKPVIFVANKIDLTDEADRLVEIAIRALTEKALMRQDHPETMPAVRLSAKTGEGLEDLRETLKTLLLRDDTWRSADVIVANARHRHLLEEARASLKALRHTIDAGMTEDFYTVDLMNAYRALGEIIGREVGDDLVNEIFSRFCMGK
ncbi:MAG: tRNA uridine-5-carboxymethylaminomethyl(34) synthesis GTPase MnmE [Lachnospiraceae bacterium]|nr:tRNA uridine-5-carboxymethylaminomethyl(34) synthesis GTPase MnmE [Lachnospiraceae bacterium]